LYLLYYSYYSYYFFLLKQPIIQIRAKLVSIVGNVRRLYLYAQTCSLQEYATIAAWKNDLTNVERRVDVFVELVRKEDFNDKISIQDLQRALGQVENLTSYVPFFLVFWLKKKSLLVQSPLHRQHLVTPERRNCSCMVSCLNVEPTAYSSSCATSLDVSSAEHL